MSHTCSFRSFFLGGFECSTHVLRCGKRLDIIGSTHHEKHAATDYGRAQQINIRTVRDGVRWHLIEKRPYQYDFSSVVPMLRAARATGTQVIWDVCHYGWPSDLDVFGDDFFRRLHSFAKAFAHVVVEETEGVPYFAPMNEISFLSWAGGDKGFLNPFCTGRGDELKRHLVRATIAAIDGIREAAPHARVVQADPIIHVAHRPGAPEWEVEQVRGYNRAAFDAWAMLAGEFHPELGGRPEYLDILGVNYYIHNQWMHNVGPLGRTDPRYKPLWMLLRDLYRRFQRPLFIAETGIEDDRRPDWFSYMCDEVFTAVQEGVPVEGICLYPVVNHPGWEDERHCHNGLWDYCNDSGHREIYKPLADEVLRQGVRFDRLQQERQRDQQYSAVLV